MIIKFINEGTFGSYKNKLSKEDKLKKLKNDTKNIILNNEIKKLIPLFQESISDGIKQIFRIRHSFDFNTVLNFKIENDADLDEFGSPWGNSDDQEYIVNPILNFENSSDTLIVQIPMFFKKNGELIFSSSYLLNELYADTFKNYIFEKNEKIQEALKEFGIKDIKVEILLTNKNNIINVNLIRFNHFDHLNTLNKFFSQFSSPVHLITKKFDTYCSFGYNDNLDEYKDLAKYVTVTDTANICINNNTIDNIDVIKKIFDPSSSSITVNLYLKNYKSYGANPNKYPISEELLKKYFGMTYKKVIEENGLIEWNTRKPEISRLSNIQFKIDKPFDFNNLKNVKFYCTKW